MAERASWERAFEQEIERAIVADPGNSLTAAALPNWRAISRKVADALGRIPAALYDRLLADRTPDAEDTAKDIAQRIAPTLATAAYNHHVLRELASRGIENKVWVTRQDGKVRESHAEAHGQSRRLSAPFTVGGQAMQYPADSSTASIEQWIHDRLS